jgi:hypothetical protein
MNRGMLCAPVERAVLLQPLRSQVYQRIAPSSPTTGAAAPQGDEDGVGHARVPPGAAVVASVPSKAPTPSSQQGKLVTPLCINTVVVFQFFRWSGATTIGEQVVHGNCWTNLLSHSYIIA